MPHQATVTAAIGPGRTNTAIVIPNVFQILINPVAKILRIDTDDSGLIRDYDISGATVITCTITAGNFAFVIS